MMTETETIGHSLMRSAKWLQLAAMAGGRTRRYAPVALRAFDAAYERRQRQTHVHVANVGIL
jgi:hypothetical protein